MFSNPLSNIRSERPRKEEALVDERGVPQNTRWDRNIYREMRKTQKHASSTMASPI